MMVPAFYMTKDDTELYAHLQCAANAGIALEQLTRSQCYRCQRQFYCETSPEEACYLLEVGRFDQEDSFIADAKRGAVHWACANRWWAPELFDLVEGTTKTIRST